MQGHKILILSISISLCVALFAGLAVFSFVHILPSTHTQIQNFYRNENAVMVSPRDLRRLIDSKSKNFVLVDIRSHSAYEREHIVGAVNIPAYTSESSQETDPVVRGFTELIARDPERDIIIYCSSAYCEESRITGEFLAINNIFVKQLSIGWNEWRYFWTMWNDEEDWGKTHAEDYVVAGTEPGVMAPKSTTTPAH